MKKLIIFGLCLIGFYSLSYAYTSNEQGAYTVSFTTNGVYQVFKGTYVFTDSLSVSSAPAGTFTPRITLDGTNGNIMAIGIVGITDGSMASAGNVGEHLQKIIGVANAVPFTTSGNWVTISTLTVTAGNWQIFAIAESSCAGTNFTANSMVEVRVATTNAITSQLTNNNTLAFDWIQAEPYHEGNVTYGNKTYPYVLSYVSVATSTAYYLMGKASYTGGSPKWIGSLTALRIR